MIAVGAGGLAMLAGALYRSGYLQPRALVATIASWQGVWLAAGFAFSTASTIQETAQVRPFASPSPEELLELLGAICLAAFALEACDASRAGTAAPPATREGVGNRAAGIRAR